MPDPNWIVIIRMSKNLFERPLSRLGEAVLQRYEIAYSYEQLVDRIRCQTEDLLASIDDPEEAYQFVKVRAGR